MPVKHTKTTVSRYKNNSNFVLFRFCKFVFCNTLIFCRLQIRKMMKDSCKIMVYKIGGQTF